VNRNGKAHVLVVDDDESMRNFLCDFLSERGYEPSTAATAEEAVRQFSEQRPSAVLLDVLLPGMDGLEVLASLKKIDREVPVIVLSGHGRTATVVQAMKLGAIDFVAKPFEAAELEKPVANALRQHQISREIATLRREVHPSKYTLLYGVSAAMAEVQDLIERIADTDVTVLIRGESGTGKELVARALYASSLRRDKPFVKMNCAALPTELLESELFGFERGAFTGANQQKPGKFEYANHGTIFLDEIGETTLPVQAKLLQVLQDGDFSRLGGKHDVHVDVRLIAATNRDLERAVAEGQFREDLFFRLNVVGIMMPSLRDRKDDIPALCSHFLKKYSVQYNKPFSEISQSTMDLFMEYDWPGNIRELENSIKRAVVLGSEAPIRHDITRAMLMSSHRASARAVPPATAVPRTAPAPAAAAAAAPAAAAPVVFEPVACSLKDVSRSAAREAERELIFKMLQQTRWNRKEAAELLGISYKALLYKIKENGLDKAS
jgi:two-component system, NtrC family, response regulator AtoC